MSFFEHGSAARRYALARPFFHPLVRDHIVQRLEARLPVDRALDVACGTGQSTTILSGLSQVIVGADQSPSMLAAGPQHLGVHFVLSSAELLAFSSTSFDLVTVALAFHWFKRAAFLTEVARVLRPSGWLVIYDNYFRGEMEGNIAFKAWFTDQYLRRYPSPRRDRRPFTNEEAGTAGLSFVARETYSNDVAFARNTLADYLTTQSNVIAAVEEGVETIESARAWILDATTPLFEHEQEVFPFGGPIWFLQRNV